MYPVVMLAGSAGPELALVDMNPIAQVLHRGLLLKILSYSMLHLLWLTNRSPDKQRGRNSQSRLQDYLQLSEPSIKQLFTSTN